MIFWEHIKGLNISGTTKAWSYINFQTTVTGNTSSDANMTCNPTVGFGDGGYGVNNKNYILTSHMTEGYINNSFSFYNDVAFTSNNANAKELTITTTDNGQNISSTGEINIDANNNINISVLSNQSFNIKQNNNNKFEINSNGNIICTPNTENVLYKKTSTNELNVVAGNNLQGACTAVYFNATSDYRAKKDFKLLDINALDLINKVRLYSFKYKDSNQPSIGIIAQDVQNININGFDLVDNKNATGDNFDYMSIHESKLVYILWKAIQEQQKEIEELKQQLNK